MSTIIFYIIYILCSVGVFIGMVTNVPITVFFSVCCAILTVFVEADLTRPKYPKIGSEEYKKMVGEFLSAMTEGSARGYLQGVEKERQERIKRRIEDETRGRK